MPLSRQARPGPARNDEEQGVYGKKEGMDPVLAGPAISAMDPFVFRHKKGREDRHHNVENQGGGGIRPGQDPSQAEKQGRRIQGMTDPLPTGKPASPMKMEFIHRHQHGLKKEGKSEEPFHF